ncbi:MFS transporter [Vallitalea okinawensis]|uniref:MFS transporter n=1 Tax=Vallitalea okinawensis TaxID=2078660 RepID=UPI000CFB2099|nr:MFS transporter [Vallitalea okinawensis]
MQEIFNFKKTRNRFFISFLSRGFIINLTTLSSVFMTSYVLFLGLEEWQIGVLASIMGLTGILQIFAPNIFNHFQSRKKAIFLFKVIQYISIYLLIIVPKLLTGEFQYYSMVLILFAFYSFHAINEIGFLEWNNKFVPLENKSEYFSTRNLLNNLIGMTSPFILGKVLDYFGGEYNTYLIIFLIYLIFVMVDMINIYFLEDMPLSVEHKSKMPIMEQIKIVFRDKNYMTFIKFNLIWTFALFFGNAYYSYYAVKYQGLNLGFIGTIGSITAFIKMLTARKCGRKVDQYGWKKILIYAGIGFGLTNLLWFFVGISPMIIYPIIIFLKGLFMITANIAKFQANLMLGKEEYRIIYLSVNGCIMGVANFISSNVVSKIISVKDNKLIDQLASVLHVDYYLIIFMLSGLLHIIAILYFNRRLKNLAI